MVFTMTIIPCAKRPANAEKERKHININERRHGSRLFCICRKTSLEHFARLYDVTLVFESNSNPAPTSCNNKSLYGLVKRKKPE
jgi:hypothetical protein